MTEPNTLKFQDIPDNLLVSAMLGDQNQFAYQRSLSFGPISVDKTGFTANNGTVDSVVINSTGYHQYSNAGTELLTIDSATGLNVTDGTNNVLKTVIQGADIGDVVIGNYPTVGAKYDKSGATFTVVGSVTANSGTIGGWSIGTDALTASSGGVGMSSAVTGGNDIRFWAGNTTPSSAAFRVYEDGSVTASSITASGTIKQCWFILYR